MIKKYKHLFFDLDHTLWDFETNSKSALSLIFNAAFQLPVLHYFCGKIKAFANV